MLRGLSLSTAMMLAAPALAQPNVSPTERASIAKSQQFVVASAAAKAEFLVQIAEPVRPLGPGELAAVVYVLDGDYMFGMAADIARNLQIVREIAPVYIVAIGYPGDDHGAWVDGRLRDMLDDERDVSGRKIGGGGRAFRQFLLDELMPLIEARMPVDRGRSYIHGHSLGGLFASSILVERPSAFSGYAIGSPSLWITPTLLDRMPAAPSRVPTPKVYVGVGSEEKEEDMVGWAGKLAQAARTKGYLVRHRTFEGEGHVSVEGVLFANAMKYLVPPA